MSDPFANINNNLGGIASEAQGKASAVASQLAEERKKFKKGKELEEGFSGGKVFLTGKQIVKSAKDNLGKYAKQEFKKGFQQFKDKWGEELQNRVEGYKPSSDPRALDPWSNDATNTGTASEEAGEEAVSEGSGDAEEFASILAKGERRLNEGEDVFREGYEGGVEGTPSGAENLASGTGRLLRAGDIEKTIQTTAAADPEEADELVAGATNLRDKMSAAEDYTNDEFENVGDNSGLAKALPEDNLENGEFGTPESAGLTQSELARATELDNKITPPTSEANDAEQEATHNAFKDAESQAQEKADKALADKLAEKTAETATEDTAEITGEESVGAFLDETGVLAPIGLLLGAVGLGTALEDAKKKLPQFSASQLVQNNAGSSFQVGIN
jgi:hypothetical protein